MGANSRFTPAALQPYLCALHGGAVRGVRVTALGGGRQGDKGYGIPLRVDYELDERLRRKMLIFVRNVLEDARFEPARANAYCEA